VPPAPAFLHPFGAIAAPRAAAPLREAAQHRARGEADEGWRAAWAAARA
jgi:hypothetical protein